MKPKLKLYIWPEFCRDYTCGLAFAIAESEHEAKKLIEKKRGYEVHDWGKLEIRRVDQRVARFVVGGG